MIILQQGEVFYPLFMGASALTSVDFLIIRKTDGFYWDFDGAGAFKDSVWATKAQALLAKTEDVWVNTTGWAAPATDGLYQVVYKDNNGITYLDEVLAVGNIAADMVSIGGALQSANDLKDFADQGYDPVTNKVQGVALVDTTTTNTDMRGTDSANTVVPDNTSIASILTDTNEIQTDLTNGGRLDLILDIIAQDTTTDIPALIAALNDIAATDIVSAGAITTLTGAVVNVDLVDTTTTNTDMRGTDSANTVVPDAAGTSPTAIEIRQELDTNSTELNTIIADVAAVLVDTGTTIPDLITLLQADTDNIQTRLPTALSAGGNIKADVLEVSSDSVAADNLEAMYDGTGYIHDSAPSSRDQLNTLANVGAAIHKPATTYTAIDLPISPPTIANDVLSTEALDGIYHSFSGITTSLVGGDTFDIEYEFNIGGGTPASVQMVGYLTGGNDDIRVFAWDYSKGTPAWVQVGTMLGSSSTTNSVHSHDLFVGMVGTGVDKGKVRVRFFNDGGAVDTGLTNSNLFIDQMFVNYNQGVEGYDLASLWHDSNAPTNTNTVLHVDGTASNPVTSEVAIQTLLGVTNLHGIVNSPGSLYTAGAAHVNLEITNQGGTFALGGQDFSSTTIHAGHISGVATAPTEEVHLLGCEVNVCSFTNVHCIGSGISGPITFTGTHASKFVDCWSEIAGSGAPIFNMGLGIGASTLEFRRWSGGIELQNLGAGDVVSIEGFGGTITVSGTGGSVNIRGIFEAVVDNSSGTVAISQVAAMNRASNAGYAGGAVWIDTSEVNANTSLYVDGTADNPVSTLVAANSLLTSLGLRRLNIAPASVLTLTQAHQGQLIDGHGYSLALGGQDIDDTHIFNAYITGTGIAANEMEFHECEFGTCSFQKAHTYNSSYEETVTWSLAGNYNIIDCQSGVPGAGGPAFIKTAGQTVTVEFRRWSGGVSISGLEAGDVITISGELGTVTLGGADATVEISGTYKSIVNNLTGSPTVNTDGAILGKDVSDILLDTGTTIPASLGTIQTDTDDIQSRLPGALVAGRMDSDVRAINGATAAAINLALSAGAIVVGTAITGTLSNTQMTTDLTETTDNHFNKRVVIWTSGLVSGQATDITGYTAATSLLTYTALDSGESPANTDSFIIV